MVGASATEAQKKGPVPEISHQKRAAFRAAAAVLLLVSIAVLIWGARWQRPSPDPFQAPSLFAWLFSPEPHRAYRGLPIIPAGSSLGLVPRSLCARSEERRVV